MAKGSRKLTRERIRNWGGGGKSVIESEGKCNRKGATINRDSGTENDAEVRPVRFSHIEIK